MLNYAELGSFAPMSDAERASLMLQAGRMTWRDMGDAATAKGFFAEVLRVFPENRNCKPIYRRVWRSERGRGTGSRGPGRGCASRGSPGRSGAS